MLRQRRPCLLPVDYIVVAVAHGRCAQAGKIRTRALLRIALAPPILPRQDARQEMRLLLGSAESVDDRTDHRETKGHQADAVGARGLFGPDETLRRGPAGDTIFDRTRGRDTASFVENFKQGEKILLGPFFAHVLLSAEYR